LPNCGDQYVRANRVLRQIGDPGMDDRDCGVCAFGFRAEQHRQRTAQGGTSAEYDYVATSGWYLIVKKHLTHARRRSWYGSRITDREATEIDWMEAVGVLAGIHAQQCAAEIQRRRQRMLNQEGVNSVVRVEPVDGRMKFVLSSACWEVDIL